MSLPAFFLGGSAVDLVLVVIAAEFSFFLFRSRPQGSKSPLLDLILAFAPGVFLLLALRAALTGAGLLWVAVFLAASFPFHLGDLLRRRL